MISHVISVVAAKGVILPADKDVAVLVQRGLADYFQGNADATRAADLIAEVTEFSCDESKVVLGLRLIGVVSGRNFSFQTRSVHVPATRSLGALGIIGGALGALLGAVLVRCFVPQSTSPLIARCVSECCASAHIELDAFLGCEESKLTRRWKGVRKLRWIVAGVVCLLPTIWSMSPLAPPNILIDCLILGAYLFAGVFLLAHVVGLALMPAEFFRLDAYGRKVMARSGVQSVGALRALCLALCVPVLAILFLLYSTSLIPEKIRRNVRSRTALNFQVIGESVGHPRHFSVALRIVGRTRRRAVLGRSDRPWRYAPPT